MSESPAENKQQMSGQEDFRKNPPKPGPAPKIGLSDYDEFTLDNGLKVVVVENHKLPRVSFRLLVDRDPVLEGKEAGLASVTGDLMSTGTRNRSKDEINEAVDFIGASFNTFSKGMSGSCLKEHEGTLLDVMSDVLMHPTFPEEELNKLISRKKSTLKAQESDPNTIANNVAKVLRYGKNHPYGDITTAETLDEISREDCKSYYQQYFKPNISYLAIVGDVNLEEAKDMARKNFGSWKPSDVPQNNFEQPQPPTDRKVCFVDVPGSVQSVINITYPVELQPGDPFNVYADVMNAVLGGGVFSGYLMQNLREDKAYTYGARSSLSDDPYVGYFNANASVRNEVTDSSIVQFFHEMNRIRDEKVKKDHLELVKNARTGSFARSLESPQRVATLALNIERYGLEEDHYDQNLERLENTSEEDVMNMARKYILPERSYLLVVGNKGEVADKLKKFAPDGKIHYYDQYGDPVEQSDRSIPEGMTGMDVLDQYLEARGGKEALKAVENARMELSMSLMGRSFEMTQIISPPDRYLQKMAMNGQVMQKQLYNDGEGYMMARGQRQPLNEQQKQSLAMEAKVFKELVYASNEQYQVELNGMEKYEDQDVYKVVITTPQDNKVTQFYNADSDLKVREITTQQGPEGQSMTVETKYGDYREINGIMTPYSITVSGGNMPRPMEMKVDSMEYNTEIPSGTFDTE